LRGAAPRPAAGHDLAAESIYDPTYDLVDEDRAIDGEEVSADVEPHDVAAAAESGE
jgi:hypothetical protein